MKRLTRSLAVAGTAGILLLTGSSAAFAATPVAHEGAHPETVSSVRSVGSGPSTTNWGDYESTTVSVQGQPTVTVTGPAIDATLRLADPVPAPVGMSTFDHVTGTISLFGPDKALTVNPQNSTNERLTITTEQYVAAGWWLTFDQGGTSYHLAVSFPPYRQTIATMTAHTG